MRFHDLQQQKLVWMSYGVDLATLCVTDLALVLWFCGYPDQALRRVQEALNLGHELAHAHSLVLARCWAAWLHQFLRRPEYIVHEPSETAITIAAEQGLSFYSGILASVHGWALAKQGNTEEGLAQITQGVNLYKANVGEHIVPYFLALLAETQSDMGRSQEAARSLSDALALAEKNGEHFYDAELYRLKGELTLQQESKEHRAGSKRGQESGVSSKEQEAEHTDSWSLTPDPQSDAEACFLKAIDIAQKQQAKSLELRAVMSLVRLRQHQAQADATRNTHQVQRSTQHVIRSLPLVHRGIRYQGFARGEGTDRESSVQRLGSKSGKSQRIKADQLLLKSIFSL